MHKLFKKGIAATMGLALSLTCLVATAVPVKAAEEKTYTVADLKSAGVKVTLEDGVTQSGGEVTFTAGF